MRERQMIEIEERMRELEFRHTWQREQQKQRCKTLKRHCATALPNCRPYKQPSETSKWRWLGPRKSQGWSKPASAAERTFRFASCRAELRESNGA